MPTKPVDMEFYEDLKYLTLVQNGVTPEKAKETIAARFPMSFPDACMELWQRGYAFTPEESSEFVESLGVGRRDVQLYRWDRETLERFAAVLAAREGD